MRKTAELLLVGLTAALILSLAISSASANKLSISNRNIRAVWTPMRFVGGGNTVSCNVTLEGSFHSATIAKARGALIGHISRGSLNNCTGGSATILSATLPWHVQYESFAGTLPDINTVRILFIGASFQFQPAGSLTCLMRTSTTEPTGAIAFLEQERVIAFTINPLLEIRLTGQGGLCAFSGGAHLEGIGVLTLLGNTTAISIRLI